MKLAFQTDYTLTIDGTVAKNTETDLFLDGDNDKTQGGNYVMAFKTAATPKFTQGPDNVMQLYVFGDASGSQLRLTIRPGTSGSIWSCLPITIDWAGWKLISWKPGVADDGQVWLAGTGPIDEGTQVNFACFGLHAAADIQYLPSYIIFDNIRIVQIGD